MGKSFEDYDKVTRGEIVRKRIILFLLALAGGLVGSIPYLVLWFVFNADSLIFFLLSGASAIAFMMEIGKIENLKWYDHLVCIIGEILSVAISYVVLILAYFAPDFVIDGNENASLVQKLFVIIGASKLDTISSKGLVTDNGSFSIFTEFFFGVFFAILGLYLAFLFIKLSGKSKKKNKKVTKK